MAIYGLGPLGCMPNEISKSGATQCVEKKNEAVELFNTKLVSLVDDFNTRLPKAKFTFVNVYAIQNLTLYPGRSIISYYVESSSYFLCFLQLATSHYKLNPTA